MIIVKAPNIEKHDAVQHGFFGRQGGVSEGIYASLNCGPGSDDNPENVKQNRERVAEHFGQPLEALQTVWQVHSADCIYVTENVPKGDDMPQVDGMVTDKPNFILGALSADCTPLLFSGKKENGQPVIGAAHSGWKGSLNGIGQNVVRKMVDVGAALETIQAAIGPCIGPASYEVTHDFADPFMAQADENEMFFKETNKDNHLIFDLPGYIASRLSACGVKDIYITGNDTYAEEDKFFSYRRKTHRNETDYGRQISAIMIKG